MPVSVVDAKVRGRTNDVHTRERGRHDEPSPHRGKLFGLQLVDQVRALGTDDATLHFHAAVVLDANGDQPAARAALARALSLDPWFSFGLRPEAVALAARLGVPTPTAWEAP